jgi:hypothetical protein
MQGGPEAGQVRIVEFPASIMHLFVSGGVLREVFTLGGREEGTLTSVIGRGYRPPPA